MDCDERQNVDADTRARVDRFSAGARLSHVHTWEIGIAIPGVQPRRPAWKLINCNFRLRFDRNFLRSSQPVMEEEREQAGSQRRSEIGPMTLIKAFSGGDNVVIINR